MMFFFNFYVLEKLKNLCLKTNGKIGCNCFTIILSCIIISIHEPKSFPEKIEVCSMADFKIINNKLKIKNND